MKTQNWTAVGLDFVIVVVGVFIGIQVSNWNDVRGDRNEERRYYEQLLIDLPKDTETATLTDNLAERNDRAADLVFAALTNDDFESAAVGRPVPNISPARKHKKRISALVGTI